MPPAIKIVMTSNTHGNGSEVSWIGPGKVSTFTFGSGPGAGFGFGLGRNQGRRRNQGRLLSIGPEYLKITPPLESCSKMQGSSNPGNRVL